MGPKDIDQISAVLDEAGERILFESRSLKIKMKPDRTPVTSADEASHLWISQELQKNWPEIPLISEEVRIPKYEERRNWKRFWLLDPLDGTRDLIHNEDTYTINLALIEDGQPTLGFMTAPGRAVHYRAQSGGTLQKSLNKGPFETVNHPPGKPKDILIHSKNDPVEKLYQVLPTAPSPPDGNTLALGGALKFALLAEGMVSTYIRLSGQSEWDVAAGDALLRTAYSTQQYYSPFVYNSENLRVGPFAIALR